MTIKYQDFHEEETKSYSNFKYILSHVNKWVIDNNINVINIETLIVPITSKKDDNKVRSALLKFTLSEGQNYIKNSSCNLQVIRVWYRD